MKKVCKSLFIIIISALCLILFSPSDISAKSIFQKIRLKLDSNFTVAHLDFYGFDSESRELKSNNEIDIQVDEYDIRVLKSKKVSYEILVDDLGKQYDKKFRNWTRTKNIDNRALIDEFELGSMGGYFTADEIYDRFEMMKKQYPEFLKAIDTVSFTFENRPIIIYTFGDTSNIKHELLITSLHHAREPGGASVVIYFLEDLLKKASENEPEAMYLLETRTLYVIPVVNPDGLYYNQSIRPQGGGMWRKNRVVNSDTSIGVDLNRNYGPYEYWNAPINGSSENPDEVTYRGTEPFSEIETRAVRDFVLSKNIKLALNYHTYGNILIYPLSALSKETDDSVYFRKLCREFSRESRYIYGLDRQTVNYSGRGVADDWFYWKGEGKDKRVFAVTPEVGKVVDNFWTTPDRILDHCKENLNMNYQFLWSADINWRLQEAAVEKIEDLNVLKIEIANIGRTDAVAKPDFALSSLDQNIIIKTTPESEKIRDNEYLGYFSYSVSGGISNGDETRVQLSLNQNGVIRYDTLKFVIWQSGRILLFEDEELQGDWDKGNWDGELNPDKERFVLSDSPNAFYPDKDTNYLQMLEPVSLNCNQAELHFQSYWEIEPNYDYGVIEISDDNGFSWKKIYSTRMAQGSGAKGSTIEEDEFAFTGYSLGWVKQTIPLNAYIGKSVLLRFGLLTDISSNAPGWRLDSIFISTYNDIVDVEALNDKIDIHVYPNPASDRLIIDIKNSDIERINVYSVDGLYRECPVYSVGASYELDISTLSKGVYFIVTNNKKIRFVKF